MVNMSYNNALSLAFDKPLEYKTLYLYPAKMPHYSIFRTIGDVLTISKDDEKDIKLLRLPYLEYMYEKSLVSEEYKVKINMLIYILEVVLKDQIFDISKIGENVYIRVYQRTKNYDLLINEYNDMIENLNKENISDADKYYYTDKIKEFQDKMYNIVTLGSEEFLEVRDLIFQQNDILIEEYNPNTERILKETKDKLDKIKKKTDVDETDLEDLITAVAFHLKLENNETLYDMTIRRFNRYVDIIFSKEDYYMLRTAQLSGNISAEENIPYWFKHYKPKSKYDGILVSSNNLLSGFDGDKI